MTTTGANTDREVDKGRRVRLWFGIPDLDGLLLERTGPQEEKGKTDNPDSRPSVICIEGPVGSGKSTLALHLAAHYRATLCNRLKSVELTSRSPIILFFSTDWRFREAAALMRTFKLNDVVGRTYGWESHADDVRTWFSRLRENASVGRTILKAYTIGEGKKSVDKEEPGPQEPVGELIGDLLAARVWTASFDSGSSGGSRTTDGEISFVDLSTFDLGDEWTLIERIASFLPSAPPNCPHLVVIDSVPGLETASGGRDLYGEAIPTEARINRLIHLLKDKANLVFTSSGEEIPNNARREEAQADFVYRLRYTSRNGVNLRTIRVIKARGFENSLDEHTLEFFSHGREAGYSDRQHEADNPREGNSIVRVFPSIQWLLYALKRSRPEAPTGSGSGHEGEAQAALKSKTEEECDRPRYAAFGIKFLDNMLRDPAELPSNSEVKVEPHPASDVCGLRSGSLAKVTGEANTHKSLLATAFVQHSIAALVRTSLAVLSNLSGTPPKWKLPESASKLCEWVKKEAEKSDLKNQKTQVEEQIKRLSQMGQSVSEEQLKELLLSTLLLAREILKPFSTILITTRYLDLRRFRNEIANALFTRYAEHPLTRILYDQIQVYKGVQPKAFRDAFIRALVPLIVTEESEAKDRKRLDLILYRRLVPRDLIPGVFFDVVRRHVEVACNDDQSSNPWLNGDATQGRGRPPLRLVIDDMEALQMACDSDQDSYTAVCSLLTTYLRRRGVTSVIVESVPKVSVRPSASSTPAGKPERFTVIKVWRVPFEGAERVAFTVEPALVGDLHGCVRELRVVHDEGAERALADPDFELYSHLHAQRPQRIPLEVQLHTETAGIQEYHDKEDAFLRTFFISAHSPGDGGEGGIIRSRGTGEYGILRDLAAYPNPVNKPMTLVVQVDGYWNRTQDGDLRSLRSYLHRDLRVGLAEEQRFEDQFHVHSPKERVGSKTGSFRKRIDSFRCSEMDYSPWSPGSTNSMPASIDRVPYTWDYGFLMIDAAAWRRAARTIGEDDERREEGRKSKALPWINEVVNAVSDSQLIHPANNEAGATGFKVGWKDFLMAAKEVAQAEANRLAGTGCSPAGGGVRAFGTAMAEPSSLLCLVLEIWISEIAKYLGSPSWGSDAPGDKLTKCISSPGDDSSAPRSGGPESIRSLLKGVLSLNEAIRDQPKETTIEARAKEIKELIKSQEGKGVDKIEEKRLREALVKVMGPNSGHFLQLYKAWLLLLEVMDFDGAELWPAWKPDAPGAQGGFVACRHWYKTACAATRESKDSSANPTVDLRPLRLPGHFSVRGDWYLGITKGSQSVRLGELALDVLTDVKANESRLAMGVGLPVRPLRPDGSSLRYQPTALRLRRSAGPHRLSLGDFLGATSVLRNKTDVESEGKPASKSGIGFHWLWRSNLYAFDCHAEVLEQWLREILDWSRIYRNRHRQTWDGGGGFRGYEAIGHLEQFVAGGEISDESIDEIRHVVLKYDSFESFARRCDDLVARLDHVTPDAPRVPN